MKYFFSLGLILGLSLAASAQEALRLQVFDQESFKPLSGALVQVEGTEIEAVTAFNGFVTLHNVPSGDRRLKVSAYRHKTERIDIRVPYISDQDLEVYLFFKPTEQSDLPVSISGHEKNEGAEPQTYSITESKDLDWLLNLNPGNLNRSTQRTNGVYEQPNGIVSGENSIRLRGLPGSSTLIAEDGIPIIGLSSRFALTQHPIFGVRQVELAKGARSASWGYGANSGVLNFINHVPTRSNELEALVQLNNTLGNDAWLRYSHRSGAWASQLLVGRSAENANDPEADGFSNRPDLERLWLKPGIWFRPNKDLELRLTAKMGVEDLAGGDILILNNSPNKADNFVEYHRSERLGADFQIKARLGKRSRLLGKAMISNVVNNIDQRSTEIEASEQQEFAEVQYIREADELEYGVGASRRYLNYAQTHNQEFKEGDYSLEVMGLFAFADWELNRDMKLHGALRLDDVRDEDLVFLPQLAMSWQLADEWSTKVMLGAGYSSAAQLLPLYHANYMRNQGFGNNEFTDLGLQRSYSAEWEVVYREAFSKQSVVQISQSFFISQLQNPVLASFGVDGDVGMQFVTLGESLLTPGFETTVDYTFLKYWNFWAGYTFTHASYQSGESQQSSLSNPRALMPDHVLKTVLYHNLSDHFRINFRLTFVGAQDLRDGSHSQAYALHGFGIENKFKWARVFLGFDNLGNVKVSDYQAVFNGSKRNPDFSDLWLANSGLRFNAGIKFEIL